MFQNASLPQLSNNALGGTSSAILHLFSPRMFSNQGKRPLAYKFDGNFVDVAVDAVSHKASTQNGIKIKGLVENPNYMSSIIPTSMPDYTINMQNMSHLWTFMLIVNNDKTGSGGITRSMADNLQIYYGYFMDEPINPNSHMGRITVNPNAAVLITHKTVVNKSSYVGQYGVAARLDTMADIDIIPAQTMAAVANAPIVSMLPEHLYGNISTDIRTGDSIIMHNEGNLFSNIGGSLDVHSRLTVPKHNVKKILDSIADTQASIQADSFQGARLDFGNDSFDLLLGNNLQDSARSIDLGLPTNLVITMETILTRYRPHINRVDLPVHSLYATQDQSVGNAKNVFSSMLATVIPAIMSDFVLAQVSFRYNSHADNGAGSFEWYGFAPITAMPDEELRSRINSFMFRLKSEIFAILKLQRGDFDLNINCDCTSVTYINLHFYADSIKSPEVYEVPTLLGGFNNSLVGTANMADANARELGSFIQIIRGDERDIPLGNYDTTRYNQAIDAYDMQRYNRVLGPYDIPPTDYFSSGSSTVPGVNLNNIQPPTDWRV